MTPKYSPTVIMALCACCMLALFSCREKTLFKRISSDHSNIKFVNTVVENDSINPIDLEFLYNGGGVAVGDFDNNGLPDLYFTASTTSNKLYLNKGDLSFEDITDKAKVTGEGRWANAASVVDINNDGWKDIYVTNTINSNPHARKNLLYINQGLNNEKIPVFKEMAAEYNLADTGYSVHAAFFDYDNDGDLDMYLLTTKLAGRTAVTFQNSNIRDSLKTDFDKLFRNDWNDSLKHPVFSDVSIDAGISGKGYGLGVAITDINQDGWKDVYVTNDFFSNDQMFVNNKNGTFSDKAKEYFKHTSQNAMGNDIADINNDGLPDVLAVDMNPEDNFRKKKNMGSNNYYVYQNMMNGGYHLQYVRNTLQLNMGPRLTENDSIGEPVFSDIGFYAGVAETDWSWNASIADFDNDGNRDIIITNGYPRDVTDHDFAAFRANSDEIAPKELLIDQMPQIKVSNYAFQNTGTLKFKNVSAEWGLDEPSFSNGAVYADLDNDGDLDYVINNINEEAMLYENTLNNTEKKKANYLQLQLKGDQYNINGLGACVQLYYKGGKQYDENNPYRGYLSTVNDILHFGLDTIATIDSVVVTWPTWKRQVLRNVNANQVLKVDIKNASPYPGSNTLIATNNIFTDATSKLGVNYRHREIDFIDFDRERLLPHKFSQYGPGLSAGDVNGDGLDDIIIGGNNTIEPVILLQQKGGKFDSRTIPTPQGTDVRKPENLGMLLFDADKDGDNDLYMTSGSNEFLENTKNYQDRLFINDGTGNFEWNEAALPMNYTSKSCVKAADFDKDGDLDLFVGGRIYPGSYPKPVSSIIYRNDSKPGAAKFTDVTKELAPDLIDAGLVCDAIWSDYDNDGWIDLIFAGEWMAVNVLKNENGKFKNVTQSSGLSAEKGWWNSLAGGDFDNDGDIDYIAGNMGENSFYRANTSYPVNIYYTDFDKNKTGDAITTVYLKDTRNNPKEFTAHNRDDINSQLPGLKKRFLTYKDFGVAGFQDIFTQQQIDSALHLSANNFKTVFIRNDGNGKFVMVPLPEIVQLAPVYGMVVDDYNSDGNLDVAMVGNDYGTEVSTGHYDAQNGLMLLGDGKGNFAPQSIVESGLFVPGDAKAFVKLRAENDGYLLAASQNRGPLKLFKKKTNSRIVQIEPGEISAIIYYKNGVKRKEEFYHGSSFISQSSRFISLNDRIERVEIEHAGGGKRTVE